MNIYEYIHLSATLHSLSPSLSHSLLCLLTLHSPLGIHKTIFFMASMAYAVKAEPAENEALKGEGVKRSRKLYWPVDCVYGRERRVHKGALLELSAIKYCLEATKEGTGRRLPILSCLFTFLLSVARKKSD